MSHSKISTPRWLRATIACRSIVSHLLSLALLLMAATPAAADDGIDWDTVPVIAHSVYQAVTGTGASAYPTHPAGFPTRLIGVVLNNSEDWLNPTADYIAWEDDLSTMWQLGGQAELFVQAVDLTGTPWEYAGTAGDFSGTAAWMGQNYGNHTMRRDSSFSYLNEEWYDELDRLGLWRPGTALSMAELVRPGDLVEIRVGHGLHYNGKMNVNENHFNDPSYDFEIVVLQQGYGLPDPAALSLDAVKNPDNTFFFDPTRQTGGEHYQSTLVEIERVHLQSTAGWAPGAANLTLADPSGRTLPLRLGLDAALMTLGAPDGWFNVTGVLNQNQTGTYGEPGFNAGYYLVAMQAASFTHLAGDADRDWDVDNSDLQTVFGNFTGPGALNKTWAEGDFTGSGAVENSDLQLAFGNFTGPKGQLDVQQLLAPLGASADPSGEPLALSGTLGNGIADLLYHPGTGEVWFDQRDAPGGIITSFVLQHGAGGLLSGDVSFPFPGMFKTEMATEISQTDPLAQGWDGADNPWLLGAVFPAGMSEEQLGVFLDQATYTGALGTGVHSFEFAVVPEPGTWLMGLAALAVAAMMWRRRR